MNLTTEQLNVVYRRFPGLQAYMNRCTLTNEFKYLTTNEHILNDWQKNRLAELRGYKESGFCDL